jgi:hypothetical protein
MGTLLVWADAHLGRQLEGSAASAAEDAVHYQHAWDWDLAAAAAVAGVWRGGYSGVLAVLKRCRNGAAVRAAKRVPSLSEEQLLWVEPLLRAAQSGCSASLLASVNVSFPTAKVQEGTGLVLQGWLPATQAAAVLSVALSIVTTAHPSVTALDELRAALQVASHAVTKPVCTVAHALLYCAETLQAATTGAMQLSTAIMKVQSVRVKMQGAATSLRLPPGLNAMGLLWVGDVAGVLSALNTGATTHMPLTPQTEPNLLQDGKKGAQLPDFHVRWLAVQQLAGKAPMGATDTSQVPGWVHRLSESMQETLPVY